MSVTGISRQPCDEALARECKIHTKLTGLCSNKGMNCSLCGSSNQVEYPAEMAIHFPGRKNLDKSHALIFPKVLICLDCGFSRFTTPETDLRVLGNGSASTAA